MCRSGSDSDSGSGSGSGSSGSSAEEEGNSDESVSDYEPSHKVKSRKPSNKYAFHNNLDLPITLYAGDIFNKSPPLSSSSYEHQNSPFLLMLL